MLLTSLNFVQNLFFNEAQTSGYLKNPEILSEAQKNEKKPPEKREKNTV